MRRHIHDEARHFHMMTTLCRSAVNIPWVLTAIVALPMLFAGCDKNQLASIDPKNSAPQVDHLTFSPDSIYLDALTPVNGEYTVTTTIRAHATDPDGNFDLAGVNANLIMPDGTSAPGRIPLHDDGVSPDSTAGDGLYSGSLEFQLTRAQAGRWQVGVTAVDQRGALSNSLSGQLKLARRNSPPLIFDLLAPDTLTIAAGDSSLLRMSIAASDSDGLADIVQVYWQSPDGQNPTFRFPMRDDGGLSPGPPSGDLVAGDGTFSFMQWIKDSPTIRGRYRLLFKAEDTVGDTSLTLLHILIIQ